MATYELTFYDGHPRNDNGFTTGISSTFTYTGPATQDGTTTITDNESGIEGQTLDDDSAGGETATATVTINGNTSTNVPVSAGEVWLVRDNVTGEEFNVIRFKVDGGAADGMYTLSERPLVPGRSYTVQDYESNADATAGDPTLTYSEFVCFAPDTMIATPEGQRHVQDLRAGDHVLTMERGPQPLVWTGHRQLRFDAAPHRQKPIAIKPGALGPDLPKAQLIVSPQHRILLTGRALLPICKSDQALGPAKGLTRRPLVRQMRGCRLVRYHTLMTPRHEILLANGLAVESFYPGRHALTLLSCFDRLRIMALFPGVQRDPQAAYGPPARRFLTRKEVAEATTASGALFPVHGSRSAGWKHRLDDRHMVDRV